MNTWTKLKTKNPHEFAPHFAHTLHSFDEALLIYGGLLNDYDSFCDELSVLSLNGTDPKKLPKIWKKKSKDIGENTVSSDVAKSQVGTIKR